MLKSWYGFRILFVLVATQALSRQAALSPLNAYVHLPFCRRRCFYCDFPIVVAGDSPRQSVVNAYIEALTREIEATSRCGVGGNTFGSAVAEAGGISTLYFGGGTPSLLDPDLLAEVVDTVSRSFGGLAENCEVTLEMVRRSLPAYVSTLESPLVFEMYVVCTYHPLSNANEELIIPSVCFKTLSFLSFAHR
jgi:coproporphyrinogen III oxidase-like Fe-S oxidoreductase